jgi:hypothetical protein
MILSAPALAPWARVVLQVWEETLPVPDKANARLRDITAVNVTRLATMPIPTTDGITRHFMTASSRAY